MKPFSLREARAVSATSPRVSPSICAPDRKVDVRLPGKGNSNSHLIITMMKWIRTSRLSIKNSLSLRPRFHFHFPRYLFRPLSFAATCTSTTCTKVQEGVEFDTRKLKPTPDTLSGDTTPCRMTGVTLHSHVHYKEIYARTCSGPGLISPYSPHPTTNYFTKVQGIGARRCRAR